MTKKELKAFIDAKIPVDKSSEILGSDLNQILLLIINLI
jgi:hypothetical protein